LTNSQQKTLKLTVEAAFRRCRVGAGLGACGAKTKLACTDPTSSPQTGLTEAGAKRDESIAGMIILLLVLIPYAAMRVLSDALGQGRLARMFFVER